jgi:hypothetical protein
MTESTPPDGRSQRGPEKGPQSEPDAPRRDGVIVVAVTVTRTGGFAGLRRTWHAEPDTAETPQWIALIDGCPWDAADPARDLAPIGADRFVWHVDARCGDAAREAALADPEVQGPWRDLIDAVRAGRTEQRPPRTAR